MSKEQTELFGLKKIILDACEEACNRALKYDESSRRKLSKLDGKTLNISTYLPSPLGNIDFDFQIHFTQQGICFSSLLETDSDAYLHASSLRMVFEILSEQKILNNPNIEIKGDKLLVTELQAILKEMEIDWEEPLSKITGDVIAHEIGNIARSAKSWFSARTRNFKEDLKDYIVEEQNNLVFQEELSYFSKQIQTTEQKVRKLSERIQNLKDK